MNREPVRNLAKSALKLLSADPLEKHRIGDDLMCYATAVGNIIVAAYLYPSHANANASDKKLPFTLDFIEAEGQEINRIKGMFDYINEQVFFRPADSQLPEINISEYSRLAEAIETVKKIRQLRQ